VNLRLQKRLWDCERIAARRLEQSWELSRISDDELEELIALQTRVGDSEGLSALGEDEVRRYRELWAKCPVTRFSP